MKRNVILIADDSYIDRQIIGNLFSDSYKILEAADGRETLDLIKEHGSQIAIVLLDFIMPNIDGLTILRELSGKGMLSDIPVIIVTEEASGENEKEAYDLGASEVIKKPIEAYVVKKRVETIIDLYIHKNNLEELVKKQTYALEEQERRLKKINNQIIETLSTVVEFRNLESGMHIKRIKHFTKILLEHAKDLYPELCLNAERIEMIASAATMHDVGKISIPDTILLKPGKFTNEEFEIMKTHTTRGCEIIKSVSAKLDDEYFKICHDIAGCHHERYDGRGYPDKLIGDKIPFEAQYVAVADVYDALISERCYKKAFTAEQAYNMITGGECGVFSPKVLRCFELAKEELEELAMSKES